MGAPARQTGRARWPGSDASRPCATGAGMGGAGIWSMSEARGSEWLQSHRSTVTTIPRRANLGTFEEKYRHVEGGALNVH